MKKNDKKIIFIILAIAIVYVLYKRLNKRYFFTNSSEKITVRKGDAFQLTFPWYVSTGPLMWWTFDNEDEIDIVEKVDEIYEPHESQTTTIFGTEIPNNLGGGGDNTFVYKAIKKGYQVMHWTRGKGTEKEIVRTIGIHVI